MALAKMGETASSELSARVTFLQLPAMCLPGDPNPCDAYVANVFYDWTQSGFANYLTGTLGAMPPVVDEVLVGQWVSPPVPPEWDGPEEYSVEPSFEMGPLYLYKVRDAEPMPEYEDGPSDPCHPLHLGMKYAWGGSWTRTVASGMGSTVQTSGTTTPSWAASGGGTADLPGGGVLITLRCDAHLHAMDPVEGVVIRVDQVTWQGQEVSFDGVDEGPTNGCRMVGDGGALEFIIDDYQAASLNSTAFSVTIYPPIILDFDLHCADWDEDGGPTFRIPRNTPNPNLDDQYIDLVTAPYSNRHVYWYKSWGGPWQRPWDVGINLDSDWAEENDEDVDPVDLASTIEEYGLSFPHDESGEFVLWDWNHFPIRRTPALSVQWPSDVDDEPPSEWESDDPTNLVVTRQSGQKTTVFTVKPGASAEVGKRELVEDYFRYFVNKGSGLGVDTYGLPAAYYQMKHLGTQYDDQQQKTWDGSDIWNWENYQFLRLTYVSDSAAELTLAIEASNVVISDDHMTGSERVTNFSYSREQVTHTFDFSIEATSTPKEIYIDLAIPYDRKLQHVDALEIRGFDGAQEDWDFEIRDLELTRYNPTTESDEDEETGPGGQVACKITFARPDSGGLPISYTGFTAVSEANQCCRPPDQIVTQCGEAGVDFVERLTGRETGTILDSMRSLQQWFNILNAQEGIQVDDTGQCDSDSSEYESAFVDADDNDMLGGLKAGDCAECIDDTIDPLPESEEWSSLAVRPRVGHVYPASGVPIPIKVRKILHGNCHGMVLVSDTRGGEDITVRLWEKDPSSGAVAVVADCLTDQWSRFDFDGDTGVRENRLLGITIPADPEETGDPPDVWYRVKNELRVFLGRPFECPEIAQAYGTWVIVD